MSVKSDASAPGLQFRQYSPPVCVSLLPLPATRSSTELEARIKKEIMT
jgi:hypothetical protein